MTVFTECELCAKGTAAPTFLFPFPLALPLHMAPVAGFGRKSFKANRYY